MEWFIAVGTLENNSRYSFVNHEPLMSLIKDEHPYQVVMKCAQVGLTLLDIILALYWSAAKGYKVLYYLPTDAFVSDHVKVRLHPMVLKNPILNNRKSSMSVGSITFDGGGVLYTKGIKPEMSVHSTPGDKIIFDERDRCDGSQVKLAKERLKHSDIPGEIHQSTPTVPGFGVDELYEEKSDRREYMYLCGSCGKHSPLHWEGGVVEKVGDYEYRLIDKDWTREQTRDIYVHCIHCGKPLNRNAAGKWFATNIGPRIKFHGYKLSRLPFTRHSIFEMYEDFTGAIGDDNEMARFYNSTLGEPYAIEGARLSIADLTKAIGEHLPMSTFPHPCFLGCDVGSGAGGMHYHIGTLKGGDIWIIDAGTTTWRGIHDLYNRYNIVCSVIDKMPETNKAREVQMIHPGVWLAYYPGAGLGGVYINPVEKDEINADGGADFIKTLNMDRTVSLDRTMASVRQLNIRFTKNAATMGDPVPGKPYNSYFAQLLSSTRIITEHKGTKQLVAVYRNSGPDHWLHALNYLVAAGIMSQRGPGTPMVTDYVPDAGYNDIYL